MIRIPEPSQSSFELAKWLAIIAMAFDHYGKIVAPDWYLPTHLIGRTAFPLFAWIIASRLALRPDLTTHYIRWLLPWALVSQPAFYLAGREWYDPNIMFELLAGVIVIKVLQTYGKTGPGLLIAIALALVGWFFDYGPAGVLSIPALFFAAGAGAPTVLLVLALVSVLVNLPASDFEDGIAAAAALGAPLVALLSLRTPAALLPRLPKLGFYLFYPLHLLFFAWLGQV